MPQQCVSNSAAVCVIEDAIKVTTKPSVNNVICQIKPVKNDNL